MVRQFLKLLSLAGIGALIGVAAAAYGIGVVKRAPHYEIKVSRAQPKDVAPPALPDISGYTVAAVLAKMPPVAPREAGVEKMKSNPDFLTIRESIDDYRALQRRPDALAIVLHDGVYDMPALLAAVGNDDYFAKDSAGYLLRIPLYIGEKATLIINGPEQSLKMDAGTGAFIASFGRVFTVNTAVSGWDSTKNGPAVFHDSKDFRPYLAFWNQSETYLAKTSFSHLGYDGIKAYGITFSSNALYRRTHSDARRPHGWIVDCRFEGLYFGFYSYEAENIAIVSNEYENSIVYAIDPHDRSERLIIAGNKVQGSQQKHGIILSREVNDSWIFNNVSTGNKGAGIMIDRNSRNNVIANNILENNESDGLVFFESPGNTSWHNRMTGNTKSGVRIRNSWDITMRGDLIADNGGYSVTAYAASLKHKMRDIKTDPYQIRAGFDMADAEIRGGLGHFRISNVASVDLGRMRLFNAPASFMGDMEKYDATLYEAVTSPGLVVRIESRDFAAGAVVETADD